MNDEERRQAEELMRQRDEDTRRRLEAHVELTPQEELREAVRHSIERHEREASGESSEPAQRSGQSVAGGVVLIGAAALGIATIVLFAGDRLAFAAVTGSIALLLAFWGLYDRFTR